MDRQVGQHLDQIAVNFRQERTVVGEIDTRRPDPAALPSSGAIETARTAPSVQLTLLTPCRPLHRNGVKYHERSGARQVKNVSIMQIQLV